MSDGPKLECGQTSESTLEYEKTFKLDLIVTVQSGELLDRIDEQAVVQAFNELRAEMMDGDFGLDTRFSFMSATPLPPLTGTSISERINRIEKKIDQLQAAHGDGPWSAKPAKEVSDGGEQRSRHDGPHAQAAEEAAGVDQG